MVAEIPNYPDECEHYSQPNYCLRCNVALVKELRDQLKEAMEHLANGCSTVPSENPKGSLHDKGHPPNTGELQGQGVYMGGIRYEILGAEIMDHRLATTEIKVMLAPKGPRLVLPKNDKC